MRNVCVLYAGGTIGCAGHPLAPMKAAEFERLLASVTGLAGGALIAHPDVRFRLDAFDLPIDSANAQPADWIHMALWVLSEYEHYDGFVILHGTDTLAWTASALSFLLRGLSKPVVLTGAQRPLTDATSDAPTNLVNAITIAGTQAINEVCVAFDKLLLRGNRSTKVHTSAFAAFDSPNLAPLGLLAPHTFVDTAHCLAPPRQDESLADPFVRERLRAQLTAMSSYLPGVRLAALHLFPGMPSSMLRAVLDNGGAPLRGLVLACFGAGNAPNATDFLSELEVARENGAVIVDVTQVGAGSVAIDEYETGHALSKVGVVSGRDLTVPAAFTKLWYLLAQGLAQVEVERLMATSVVGEMSV